MNFESLGPTQAGTAISYQPSVSSAVGSQR